MKNRFLLVFLLMMLVSCPAFSAIIYSGSMSVTVGDGGSSSEVIDLDGQAGTDWDRFNVSVVDTMPLIDPMGHRIPATRGIRIANGGGGMGMILGGMGAGVPGVGFLMQTRSLSAGTPIDGGFTNWHDETIIEMFVAAVPSYVPHSPPAPPGLPPIPAQSARKMGEFAFTGSGYIGLQVPHPSTGSPCYAWLHVSAATMGPFDPNDEFAPPMSVVIDGWAIEDQADVPIAAGDFVVAPTVSMDYVNNITKTSAMFIGYLDDDGGEPCQFWFSYKAVDADKWQTSPNTYAGQTGELLTTNLSGLTAGTTYEVKAHVKNSVGEAVSSNSTLFTTDPRLALMVSSTAGGTVSAPGEGEIEFTDVATIPVSANPIHNCVFAGWSGSAVDAGKVSDPNAAACEVTVDNELTLKANFLTTLTNVYADSNAPGDPNHLDAKVSDPNEDGSAEHPFDGLGEALEVSGAGVTVTVSDTMSYGPIGGDKQTGLLFVNSAVSDPSEDGSLEHPFDTIQEALAAATTGTTVVVQPGVYLGPFDL